MRTSDGLPPLERDAWSFALLPDTQIYARSYPELFEAQTRWIAQNAERRRIRFVLHAGDIVDDNGPEQWQRAEAAIRILDGRVPYLLALGNHDYGPGGSGSDRTTLLFEHFSLEEMRAGAGLGGTFEEGRFDNAYYLHDTPDGPWLILVLEFGPRDAVVDWARSVLRARRTLPAILLTHAYLYDDDTRYDRGRRPEQKWSPYAYGIRSLPGGVNDGEALFQKLVRAHDPLQLVLCGHVLGRGTGRLTSPQEGGSRVHQLLANYQHRQRGGAALLRLIEIHARRARIRVRTYSPVLGARLRDPDNELELPLPRW